MLKWLVALLSRRHINAVRIAAASNRVNRHLNKFVKIASDVRSSAKEHGNVIDKAQAIQREQSQIISQASAEKLRAETFATNLSKLVGK